MLCSDGARVLVRDSTGHHSGSTLRALLHARLACILTVFRTVLLYVFRMCFVRFLRGINRLLLVTSSRSPQSPTIVIVWIGSHTVLLCRIL